MNQLQIKCIAIFLMVLAFSMPVNQEALSRGGNSVSSLGNDSATAMALFEEHIKGIYDEAGLQQKGLNYSIFKYAITGYYNMLRENKLSQNRQHLTVIDFRKPSNEKRLYTIDLATRRVLHHTWVAHGKNSGLIYAQRFSNNPESLQSSLGFYKTDNTYNGQHGYSLYLDGMESGFNHHARSRAIVMHGADYVTQQFIAEHGRAGRSWGCPAVPLGEHTAIIDNIKWGNCLFVYNDDLNYLNNSAYLNLPKAADYFASNRVY